eukprot:scaffold20426_cov47-Attheya_sp.AAC.12
MGNWHLLRVELRLKRAHRGGEGSGRHGDELFISESVGCELPMRCKRGLLHTTAISQKSQGAGKIAFKSRIYPSGSSYTLHKINSFGQSLVHNTVGYSRLRYVERKEKASSCS